MSTNISLIRPDNEVWAYLCNEMPSPLKIARLTNEGQLFNAMHENTLDIEVAILGSDLEEPLHTATWIHAWDQSIQIFILSADDKFTALKQSLEESSVLGPQISIWQMVNLGALPLALKKAVAQAKLQRNFKGSLTTEYARINTLTSRQNTSKENFDRLMDHAGLGMIHIEAQSAILNLNHTAGEILQMDKHKITGKPIFSLFQADEEQRIRHLLTSAKEPCRQTRQQTFQIKTGNETLRFCELSVLTSSPDSGMSGTRLLIRDVSERVIEENRLSNEKDFIQITLNNMRDGVIATDADGKVQSMNPIAETLTGHPEYAAQNKPLNDVLKIIDAKTRERIPDPVSSCLSAGHSIESSEHCILIDRHGAEHAVEGSAVPVYDNNKCIKGAVLLIKDVSDTYELAREISHQATHDPLTGLLNRRIFEERLDQAIDTARLHDIEHTLCYFDLDQFKIINVRAGHVAGDAVLKQVSNLLSEKIRSIDTLARLGGDEFSLLLENTPIERAKDIAKAMMGAINNYRFDWNGRKFEIGASIGMVPITTDTTNTAQLLTQADLACNTAKDLGRNRIHVYRSDDTEMTRRQTEILHVAGVTDALRENRFILYCQPIVSLSSAGNTPVHYELLLRLLDASSKLVMPKNFIPAAERYGVMSAIDRWVIHTAFKSYDSTFSSEGNTQIAINLSGNSLSDHDLQDFILREFDASGMSPERVCFEITETAAISNLAKASEFISSMKTNGCQFALDDFGSGLSSFTYLKNLPVDYLKIDGSFVLDMADDSIDYAMVEAINQVGHVLGIDTIAECVESEDVVVQLRNLGVDYAQGYALGTPLPMKEVQLIN